MRAAVLGLATQRTANASWPRRFQWAMQLLTSLCTDPATATFALPWLDSKSSKKVKRKGIWVRVTVMVAQCVVRALTAADSASDVLGSARDLLHALLATPHGQGAGVTLAARVLRIAPRAQSAALEALQRFVLRPAKVSPDALAALSAISARAPRWVRAHASQLFERDPEYLYSQAIAHALLRTTPQTLMPYLTGATLMPATLVDCGDASAQRAELSDAWCLPPQLAPLLRHLAAADQAAIAAHAAALLTTAATSKDQAWRARHSGLAQLAHLPDAPRDALQRVLSLEHDQTAVRDGLLQQLAKGVRSGAPGPRADVVPDLLVCSHVVSSRFALVHLRPPPRRLTLCTD